MTPIYDPNRSYAENGAHGPFFDLPIPPRPAPKKPLRFLGFEINSPLGVPAGPLLNARWIALAAKLGFDVPTYKTIRSFAHPGHPLPNILYVEPTGPHTARALRHFPNSLEALSITNSFGMPSQSPEFLLADIERANKSLSKGQVMIVSVVGSPNQNGQNGRNSSFLDDFLCAAKLAKEAGAKIIEANFSCPNVEKSTGCLYMSPDSVYEYTRKIAEAIHPIPLILKVGLFANTDMMAQVFSAAARGGARAIAGINTISMEVVNEEGQAALGQGRKTSGVCGSAIRPKALQFIREGRAIIDQEKLDLELIGCGGIVAADQFDEFLNAGAHLAMTATGMMWDPFLALQYHSKTERNETASPHPSAL